MAVFIIIQTVFISLNRKYSFEQNVKTHYGVMLTLAANLALWWYFILDESRELFHIENSNNTRSTVAKVETNTSNIGNMINTLEPYRTPMVIEYNLLSATCLLSLQKMDRCSNINLEVPSTFQYDSDNVENDAEDSLLLNSRIVHLTWQNRLTLNFIAFTLAIPMICLEIYIGHKDVSVAVHVIFQILQILNISILAILSMILLSKLSFRTTGNGLSHGRDTMPILICSSFGIQMYDIFGAFGGIVAKRESLSVLTKLTITKHVLSFLGVIYQTVLIIKCKRHSHQYCNIGKREKIRAKSMIFIITLINFGFWFGDCFFMKYQRNLMYSETVLYGKQYWRVIVDILYPVTIFYRFHSGIECYEIYKHGS